MSRILIVDDEPRILLLMKGLLKANGYEVETAKDGGKVHSDFYMLVSQNAEQITLDKQELTVDTGRNALLKATVLPKETNDKAVVWTSSDEKVAKVNSNGLVTGVARGDCEIVCTSFCSCVSFCSCICPNLSLITSHF